MRKAAGYLAILMSIALLFLATAGANPAAAWTNATVGVVKVGTGNAICAFFVQGLGWEANKTLSRWTT